MRAAVSATLPSTTCQFADILDIWGDGSSAGERIRAMKTYQQKVALVQTLPLSQRAWCCKHERLCPLTSSDVRIQGVPCPDWSNAGTHSGVHGPLLPTAFAAGAKANATKTTAVVLECVPALPQWLIEDSYGADYTWHRTHISPSDVGFEFIARPRQVIPKLVEKSSGPVEVLQAICAGASHVNCCTHR